MNLILIESCVPGMTVTIVTSNKVDSVASKVG